jgi:hypothetical protein
VRGLPGKTFDYGLSNPPFGVEWKKIEKEIRREAEKDGFNGRFGPGLPRVSDGSLLFLLHLISKMRHTNSPPTPLPNGEGSRKAMARDLTGTLTPLRPGEGPGVRLLYHVSSSPRTRKLRRRSSSPRTTLLPRLPSSAAGCGKNGKSEDLTT